jgi:predicted secreted protein
MAYQLIIIFTMLCSQAALASRQQFFDVIGSSPKGQFVALEEYGYQAERKVYYVTIKIMNVWKKQFVGEPTLVEVPAKNRAELTRAREKAKVIAQEELKKFNVL